MGSKAWFSNLTNKKWIFNIDIFSLLDFQCLWLLMLNIPRIAFIVAVSAFIIIIIKTINDSYFTQPEGEESKDTTTPKETNQDNKKENEDTNYIEYL